MKVSFISLGCAKNLVNCEQMMALVRDSGHTLCKEPDGADVVVINTCGFIDSAKSEAIDNILQMAELKTEGRIKKILVSGCLSQRYGEQILEAEVPMAEMTSYAIDLRSITQSRGSFSFHFVRYEEAPPAARDKAIQDAKDIQDEG